jgi:GT2 family glycosyltransferase
LSAWLNRILRRKPPPARYRGHLDALHDFVADGWAIDFQSPDQPVTVELLVDGIAVAETLADRPRPDLRDAMIGSGFHGFVVAIPETAFDGQHHAIGARIRNSNHLLVGAWPEVMLGSSQRPRYDGAVTGIEGGSQLRGYCRSLADAAAPLTVDLMLDGIRIAQTLAAGASPINELANGCGFAFDLARLWRPDLLSGALECRVAGTNVAYSAQAALRRAVTLEKLQLLDGALVGAIQLPAFVPADTPIDLVLDSLPAESVHWQTGSGRNGGVLRQFRVPLSLRHTATAPRFEARLRDLGYQIGQGRDKAPAAAPNLLANPGFLHWHGARPDGWQLTEAALLRCLPEHCLLDLADAELRSFGPLALRLELAPAIDDGAATWPVALLSQALDLTLPATARFLDCVLVARADPAAVADVLVDYCDRDGHGGQLRAALTLDGRWEHQRLSLKLPDDVALQALTLSIPRAPEMRVLQVAAIGLGAAGFEMGLSSSTASVESGAAADDVMPDANALVNGGFEHWSRGLRFESIEHRQQTADRWFVRAAAGPAAVTIALEKVSVRGAGDMPPREHFGMGIAGESTITLRLETPLDPLSLRVRVPELLRFHASRKPHRSRATPAAPIERILLIQRSPRPASEAIPLASHDEVLCVIARRIFPSQAGRYHEFRLPQLQIDWAALTQQIDSEASDQSAVLLAFEFAGAIDCVLADVFFGAEEQPVDSDPEAGYIGLEDPNIINQLDLVKGIAGWGSRSGIAPAEAIAGAQQDVAIGAAAGSARWKLPYPLFPSVEIVIPVYNASQDVSNCLRSIERHTTAPYLLTLVDDASDAETEQMLRRYAQGRPWVRLIRNPANLGYTRSANLGLSQSVAQWLLLLNSDTLATPAWLEGLVECALSDPAIKLVGALSNAASWQSVPELFDSRGKFKINALPEGWSPEALAALVQRESARAFPRVPLLNGFCTLIERDALERLGYLDEVAFPVGYGEENDLCLRALKAGHQLAIADHVYVYHVKSASFGSERRDELSRQGMEQLRRKHPDIDLQREQQTLKDLPALAELRCLLSERLSASPAPTQIGAG